MIASLPMYDRPETAAANDRLWPLIRFALSEGPDNLRRDENPWDHWQSPDLLLSQTCGYPYRAKLADAVTLVATPTYDIACDAGHYFSAFVVRIDDPRPKLEDFASARLAYNEALSQSGWAAPQNHAALNGFQFKNVIQSGAHIASARMVAQGQADIAALDAVSWKLMQRFDPWAKKLRVIATTTPTLGLPFITAKTRDPAPIRVAITTAISRLTSEDRDTLCLEGLTFIPREAYLAVPTPASP